MNQPFFQYYYHCLSMYENSNCFIGFMLKHYIKKTCCFYYLNYYFPNLMFIVAFINFIDILQINI